MLIVRIRCSSDGTYLRGNPQYNRVERNGWRDGCSGLDVMVPQFIGTIAAGDEIVGGTALEDSLIATLPEMTSEGPAISYLSFSKIGAFFEGSFSSSGRLGRTCLIIL